MTLTPLERSALDLLVGGEDPDLARLREQVDSVTVTRRDLTGVGFYTHFSLPLGASPAAGITKAPIADVYGEVEGLPQPVGFSLWVKDGLLDCLECWIHDRKWPDDAELKRVYYVRPVSGDQGALVEVATRDVRWALGHRAA
ncbi:MAG TPA: hypothetical protein VEV39_02595 [Gemmatimonadales bacterium]|nr:hypothetical protein [Gemmatimonadales bacterium]